MCLCSPHLQDNERNMNELLAASQHLAERYQTELSGERLYRNELESKMNSLCIDTEKEAKILAQGNEECKLKLKQAEESLNNLRFEYDSKLKKLELRLKELENGNHVLSKKYLKLLGANRKCAEEMRAQAIELPQDVDQLQFLCLQLREELIETRAAREHRERELIDEIATLQMQRKEDSLEKERLQMAWTSRVNDVNEELQMAKVQVLVSDLCYQFFSKINTLQDTSQRTEELEKLVREYRVSIEDLEKQLKSLQNERNEFEVSVNNYKQKCSALQQELDTSETVQKDFVKLSQDLQIQLEKIRQAEQEVRWQFDEDVYACNQCNQNFNRNRVKMHCLHCGKIFCSSCLAFSVTTGPHGRLAKRCCAVFLVD
uniref:FYVE-type domain-containing protein n=1 Tax=Syphacia muris TaxID=451379 RepID=A0A0N5ADD9_9BILA